MFDKEWAHLQFNDARIEQVDQVLNVQSFDDHQIILCHILKLVINSPLRLACAAQLGQTLHTFLGPVQFRLWGPLTERYFCLCGYLISRCNSLDRPVSNWRRCFHSFMDMSVMAASSHVITSLPFIMFLDAEAFPHLRAFAQESEETFLWPFYCLQWAPSHFLKIFENNLMINVVGLILIWFVVPSCSK